MRHIRSTPGLLALLALAAPAALAAQERGSITGRVTDAQTGEPVSTAQVLVRGTGTGTQTDRTGRYLLLEVAAGEHTVAVVNLGYAAVEQVVAVTPGEVAVADFALRAQAISLQEVVVTGAAAETSKRKMGNSIATLDVASELEASPISSVGDLVRGRIPGVQSAVASGTIGTSGVLQVRGLTSLTLAQDPVVYVDGVRIDGGFDRVDTYNDAAHLGGQNLTRLGDLKPSDIARIEVVKGAAAATMYGTQGSNGVLQIFTKRGRVGAPRFTLEIEQGFERTPTDTFPGSSYPDFVGPTGFRALDPVGEVRIGHHARYDLSVAGGSPDMQYYASAGWKQQEASIRPSSNWLHQFAGRANLDASLPHDLRLSVRSGIVDSRLRVPRGDNALEGIYSHLASGVPYTATEERPYGERFGSVDAHANELFIYQDVLRNTTGLQLEHRPSEHFRQALNVGIDWYNEETTRLYVFGYSGSGFARGDKQNAQRNRSDLTVDYRATLASQLAGAVTSQLSAGLQGNFTHTVRVTAQGRDFPAPGVSTVSAAASTTAAERRIEEVNAGVFVEQTVGLWDRLFFTAGLRVDGNSAFGNSFSSQAYPKAALAYNLSDEAFWPRALVAPLKLRVAYGTSGVAPAQFAADRTYEPIGAQLGQPGVTPGNIGNEDLGPERSEEIELGFDAGFLDERVGLEVTAYRQRTRDALLARPFPPSQGFLASQLTNIGEIRNQGLEVGLNALLLQRRGLQWTGSANFATQSSEVVDLGGIAPFNVGFARVVEGYPVNAIWGYDLATWDPVTRRHTRTDEQSFRGGSDPKWFGSIASGLELGRFSFAALADYAGGHVRVNFAEWWNIRVLTGDEYLSLIEKPHGTPTAASDSLLDYAQALGSSAPKFVHESDYLTVRELSAGYRLPDALLGRFGFDESTLRLAVRNVWTFSKWNGISPETERRGAAGLGHGGDWSTVPPSRIFTLLLRTTF